MPPLCSYSQFVELASPWPGELAKGPPRPPSLLPYSANVKLTARLSALAVRKTVSSFLPLSGTCVAGVRGLAATLIFFLIYKAVSFGNKQKSISLP